MLFAQTGSTPTLPKTSADAEVNPYLIALWWAVPLAIAALWVAMIVSANKAKERRKLAAKLNEAPKAKETRMISGAAECLDSISDVTDSSDLKTTQPTKLKKSKKVKNDKQRGEPKSQPAIGEKVAATNSPEKTVVAPTSQDVSDTKSSTDNASAIPSQPIEPKASNAIFEPLRDASRGRRKSFEIENFDDREPRSDSSSREKDAYNQLFGGKFERIIPKQSLRSVANRWPTAESQPASGAAAAVPRVQPVAPVPSPAAGVKAPIEAPAPAKGLKSFVSKVKNTSGPVSEPQDPPSDSLSGEQS